jgi:transcriptional regulator with XRE-family HTH domain
MTGSADIARARRLRKAREAAGFPTAVAAAQRFGWSRNTFSSNENGNAPFSFKRARAYAEAFGVSTVWLYGGDEFTPQAASEADGARPAPETLVPVVGKVGADLDGRVLFAYGQGGGDLVPLPPGGSDKAVALQVAGYSMPGFAEDGGLIYFEQQMTPPTPDMLGQIVVVETAEGEVLVKRLLRGSTPRLYDLEGLVGPTRRDCRLRWAAHITAIIPPHQARRIIRSNPA